VSAIGPPVERRNVVSSASVSVFGTASTGPVVGGVNGFGTITARIAAMSFACARMIRINSRPSSLMWLGSLRASSFVAVVAPMPRAASRGAPR
jgi:hypothetical protein